MLDLLAAILSGGKATHQVARDSLRETHLSQVFLAFDLAAIAAGSELEQVVNEIIQYVQGGKSANEEKVRYPGEHTLEIRKQNWQQGIPIEPGIWQYLQDL